MFSNLGTGELLVILLVALLIFGSKRMPEIGRAMGRGIREFNRARQEVTDTLTRLTDEVEKPMAEVNKQIRDATEIGVGASVVPSQTASENPTPQAIEEANLPEAQQTYLALLAVSRKTQIKE